MKRLDVIAAHDRDRLQALFGGGWEADADVRAGVAAILSDVRKRGDDALVELTRRFDAPTFEIGQIRVAVPSLAHARSLVPPAIAAGLEIARERVAAFHRRQLADDVDDVAPDGTRYGFVHRPLAAIGAYVPGGTATLPSSLIMTCVPARVAGVERVVATTPPGPDGRVNAAILFAAALCGVDELYAVGGAQAIAALAYGTATIAAVDKIVGPGNVWVTEAKREVFGICGIDGLAGPSEVLVIADDAASPTLVAGEMLAQAEHDPLARVAAASTSRPLLEAVADLLGGEFAATTPRAEIVARVLAERAFLIEARDDRELLDVVERFAPEHLSLQLRDPWPFVKLVRRAGAIFVGDQTPVAAGDYIAGTNHVLPTSGAGRFSSGLRTADFQRTMSVVEYSAARMRTDAPSLAALADFEGLPAHALTARLRAGSDA